MSTTSILFVCLGNICRSPMAEFIMKNIVANDGKSPDFIISSAATSDEEQGNGIHYGTRKVLTDKGIPFTQDFARKITKEDYCKYDYIIGMDQSNIRDMLAFFGGDPQNKIRLLLSFTEDNRSVADPWYTGNFEKTYNDILLGCRALYQSI
ncbi:MAG: low molecular weight protein-tyrosine-phosphatase [Acutalibacteraceae bacterium]|nr:low molecular weight protein-tyrosine-phosphatase [Acutalibacteraceae bacterium]